MAFFPADIVSDILLRLPVKPLLRFRSVCKIWCSLIDSDQFIKLHLHRSIHTKNNLQIIRTTQSADFVDTISLDSLNVAGKELDYPLVPEKLELACKEGHTYHGLVSCNGLVFEWTDGHGQDTDIIAISNPSTRKCQTLPPSKDKLDIHFNGYRSNQLGFGYDAVNDDYKVVKLNYIKSLDYDDDGDLKWDIQVYSLNSNSWRSIKDDFPYEIYLLGSSVGVFAQGALHFVVTINPEEEHHFVSFATSDSDPRTGIMYDTPAVSMPCFDSVAAFDLATEETRLVPLPDFGVGNDVSMDLVALEGSLCIVAYFCQIENTCLGAYDNIEDSDRNFLGVWVMKDYGVEESWNKLLSAAQLSFMGSSHKVVPLAYSKNGSEVLLLQDDEEFIWFNLENDAARKVPVCSSSTHFQAQVFVQSLVPLGHGGKTNLKKRGVRDTNKKRQKKIGMKRDDGDLNKKRTDR